jgi:hypothetical protein
MIILPAPALCKMILLKRVRGGFGCYVLKADSGMKKGFDYKRTECAGGFCLRRGPSLERIAGLLAQKEHARVAQDVIDARRDKAGRISACLRRIQSRFLVGKAIFEGNEFKQVHPSCHVILSSCFFGACSSSIIP